MAINIQVMLRDKLNSKEKYSENIDFDIKCNKRDYEEYIVNKHNWDSERIMDQFSVMIMRNKQILISKYSLGLPVSELKEDYIQGISFMEKGWQAKSGYVEMVWYLSIGIMLEIEDEYFNKLVSLVERDNLQDYLVDFLIQYRNPNRAITTESFEYPKPYTTTQEVINLAKNDKTQAIERLKKYINKEWYPGHGSCGWHGDHKSKWGVHFGYWSFESGALVKILKLDDTILKEQPYYPYDMVHWKE